MTRLKLAARLYLGIGTLLAVILGLTAVAAWKLSIVDARTRELATGWMPEIKSLAALRDEVGSIRRCEFQHLLADSPESIAKWDADFQSRFANLDAAKSRFEALDRGPAQELLYEDFITRLADYRAGVDRMAALSRDRKKDEARKLMQGDNR